MTRSEIPMYSTLFGFVSRDRSTPSVGSMPSLFVRYLFIIYLVYPLCVPVQEQATHFSRYFCFVSSLFPNPQTGPQPTCNLSPGPFRPTTTRLCPFPTVSVDSPTATDPLSGVQPPSDLFPDLRPPSVRVGVGVVPLVRRPPFDSSLLRPLLCPGPPTF